MRRKLLTTVMVLLVLVAGACGGDDDDNGSAGGSDGDTSATTQPKPTGAPIKLSIHAPVEGVGAQPEILSGAQAAVKAVNDAGGVADSAGGAKRPLELLECKERSGEDPEAGPLKCANDAIAAGVVASVSKYSFSQSATKAFGAANIPMVGTIGVSAEDYTNPKVFPISAGAAASGGAGAALQAAGAKTIAFMSADNPAGRFVPNFIKPVLNSPSDLVNETYIPFDPSVDVSPFVARVIRANPDGVVIAQSSAVLVKLVTSFRQSGYQGRIGVATLSPATMEQMGSAADGLINVSSFEAPSNTSNETIKRFNEEMDAHDEDAAKDEFSLNAWLTVHFVADQLAKLPKIDGPSFLAALNAHPTVDLGAAPPFQIGVGNTYVKLPNVFRTTVQYQKVEDGKLVKNSDFVNLDELAKK